WGISSSRTGTSSGSTECSARSSSSPRWASSSWGSCSGWRAASRRGCDASNKEVGGMRLRVLSSVGLVLAMVATACGGGGGGAGGTPATQAAASPAPSAVAKATCAAKKVTIAVPVTPPNVVHLTPYVADAFGYFRDENLTAELIRFEGGVGSLRASASGAIDLAGTSSEPVIDGIANGADVKIVYSYPPNVDVSFAVGPSIKTMADLKGKKLGVQEPTANETSTFGAYE